jgi:hypothetical protein
MMRNLIRYAALAAVVSVGACDLKVANPNNPETARVLATPADVESTISSYYKRWHAGMWSTLSNVQGMANVQSFEDYSSLSNNCMGQRVGIPRAANDNTIGNGCAAEQLRVYALEAETDRVASSILKTLGQTGFTLGSSNQDNRAKAFGQFLRGVSLGYLALFYDSAAITDPTTGDVDAGDLKGYKDVMAAALDALNTSITIANTPGTGGNGFPLPAGWIPSSTSFTQAEFIKLVHSYAARLRANVARTPAERAAVNWDLVIADAAAGISANHDNITSTTVGPYNSWLDQYYAYGTWHQMTPFIIGMADVSGAYQTWLAQPIATRGSNGPFFMQTPDLRFPQGSTRAAQQADFALAQCNAASQVCKRYFVNRPAGNDVASGSAWGLSNYDHARWWSWRTAGDGSARNGKLVFMTKAEMDMLQAEGQIRKGNYTAAAALINTTRVAAGLPAITAFDGTTGAPGDASCVPQVPVGPSFTTTACGNMMEMMKYEARMEEAYTGFAQWFINGRGWGDLPAGTGYHWAVPYQDLQARGRPLTAIYSTGGGTNPGSAVKGTYGW